MTAIRLALACILLAAGCGGEAAQPTPPAPVGDPVPEALAGMWIADDHAVRETVLRHLRARADLGSVPPGDRAAARADMEAKADAFVAKWSMQLTLRQDRSFVYRLAQPNGPTLLRAGRFRVEGTLLILEVEETRNEAGKVLTDPWPAKWLTHEVRWEEKRLRFKALGRDTFEFLLYRD